MKCSKEERLEIGRKIHESGLSNLNASILFGVSEESARHYRILYEKSQGIEYYSRRAHKGPVDTVALIPPEEPVSTSNNYSSMTREELMKSKIREARSKKRISGEESWCG